MKTLTDHQNDFFNNLGITLYYIQTAEHILQHTLLWAIQSGNSSKAEDFEQERTTLSKKKRTTLSKKTARQLLRTLRQRCDITDEFATVLKKFLNNRNILAHDQDRIEGFTLSSLEGLKAGHRFILQLHRDTEIIVKTFCSLNLAWAEEARIETGHEQTIKGIVGMNFLGIHEEILFAKTDAK